MKDIEYQWKRNGFAFDAMATSEDLEILGTKISTKEIQLSSGNYSRLVSEIFYVKSMASFVTGFFLPLTFLTSVSLLTFASGSPSVAASCVSAAAGIATLFLASVATLASSERMRGSHCFAVTCSLFALASLLHHGLRDSCAGRTRCLAASRSS